jgi:hypothetical protein
MTDILRVVQHLDAAATRLLPNQIQRNFAVRNAVFAEGYPVNLNPSPNSKEVGHARPAVIPPPSTSTVCCKKGSFCERLPCQLRSISE